MENKNVDEIVAQNLEDFEMIQDVLTYTNSRMEDMSVESMKSHLDNKFEFMSQNLDIWLESVYMKLDEHAEVLCDQVTKIEKNLVKEKHVKLGSKKFKTESAAIDLRKVIIFEKFLQLLISYDVLKLKLTFK